MENGYLARYFPPEGDEKGDYCDIYRYDDGRYLVNYGDEAVEVFTSSCWPTYKAVWDAVARIELTPKTPKKAKPKEEEVLKPLPTLSTSARPV